MLITIMDFLQRLREGISKPKARITVEEHDILEPGDAIRLRFVWYEEPVLGIQTVITREEINRASWDEDGFIDRIIQNVNQKLLTHAREGAERTEKST